MSIESGTTIAQFNATWPLNGDPMLEGDDHIRLVKSLLKAQFPGVASQGFAIVIDATEAEINFLVGVTSSIQTQITDNLNAAAAAQSKADANAITIANKADTTYVNTELAKKAILISTPSAFGGFKHTFSGGILNLITV